jgi:hypothetical protein
MANASVAWSGRQYIVRIDRMDGKCALQLYFQILNPFLGVFRLSVHAYWRSSKARRIVYAFCVESMGIRFRLFPIDLFLRGIPVRDETMALGRRQHGGDRDMPQ